MSILLDALKKSEEQRQLGQTPDIHAPSQPPTGPGGGTSTPWLPILLLVAATVIIATFSWRQYSEPEGLAAETISEQPAVASRPAGEDPAPIEKADGQPAARNPLATYTAPPVETAADDATQPVDEQQKRELAQSFNQFQRPPGEAEPPPGPRTEPLTPAPERPAAPSTERRVEDDRGGSPGPRPVSFWELPQNVRDSMPELGITVLVYADSPEDRFVLVNGRRMVEQDSLEGVVLDEIRRDGAVFLYRNYRFLVRN